MKKHFLFLLLLLSLIVGCNTSNERTIHQELQEHTDEIFDNLVQIRRDFHRYPELVGDEIRTSQIIAKHLTDLGLDVRTGVAGYGVVGILKGGKKGKNIAWRADMDALSYDLPDEVPYCTSSNETEHCLQYKNRTKKKIAKD